MFVHLVVWRVQPETPMLARLACKTAMENLNGKIPGLIRASIGIDTLRGPNSGDISLYAEFVDRTAYETYLAHPLHDSVKPFLPE